MEISTESALRQQYQTDGFLLHRAPVLSVAQIEAARRGMEAVRDGIYDTGTPPADSPWKPGDDPDKLCKIEQPQLANFALREAIGSPELGRIAGEITGAQRVQVWWVQLLIKPSTAPNQSAATNVGWHQDQQYWKAWDEGSELFTAWLALSDVTLEAGAMSFVPGSQDWGLLEGGNFFGQDQSELRQNIALPAGASWQEVPATLPPGGVSFHHRLLFHGSGPNVSGQPRLSLAIHLRTEKSAAPPDSWGARYLDDPQICPVIYDAAA